MRRSVVGMGLLLAALTVVPRAARADLITFYGCAKDLPGACLVIDMTGSALKGYVGIPEPNTVYGVPVRTSSGARFTLYDSFSWSLPDGTCFGGATSPEFAAGSCAAQNPAAMVILGSIDWEPADGPSTFLPVNRSQIAFTATPEPASVALTATGMLAIVGFGMSRRRRSNPST